MYRVLDAAAHGGGCVVTSWLRARWPKVTSGLALAAVAGVAGVISYTHIYRLTLVLHQPVMVARLMPIAVDGLVVVGSVVLLQAIAGQRWLGWVGVGPGVAISLFANVESGIRYGPLAAAWAGIPAVAFALSTFMFERWLKVQVSESLAPAGASDQQAPAPVGAESDPPAVLNGHSTGWAAAPSSGWSQ
jgi:uncharacterized protein DUF2637